MARAGESDWPSRPGGPRERLRPRLPEQTCPVKQFLLRRPSRRARPGRRGPTPRRRRSSLLDRTCPSRHARRHPGQPRSPSRRAGRRSRLSGPTEPSRRVQPRSPRPRSTCPSRQLIPPPGPRPRAAAPRTRAPTRAPARPRPGLAERFAAPESAPTTSYQLFAPPVRSAPRSPARQHRGRVHLAGRTAAVHLAGLARPRAPAVSSSSRAQESSLTPPVLPRSPRGQARRRPLRRPRAPPRAPTLALASRAGIPSTSQARPASSSCARRRRPRRSHFARSCARGREFLVARPTRVHCPRP